MDPYQQWLINDHMARVEAQRKGRGEEFVWGILRWGGSALALLIIGTGVYVLLTYDDEVVDSSLSAKKEKESESETM